MKFSSIFEYLTENIKPNYSEKNKSITNNTNKV